MCARLWCRPRPIRGRLLHEFFEVVSQRRRIGIAVFRPMIHGPQDDVLQSPRNIGRQQAQRQGLSGTNLGQYGFRVVPVGCKRADSLGG